MSKQDEQMLYERQEEKIRSQSDAFIQFLTKRGLLGDSDIQVLPNMYHGEFSINYADDYVKRILEIVKHR